MKAKGQHVVFQIEDQGYRIVAEGFEDARACERWKTTEGEHAVLYQTGTLIGKAMRCEHEIHTKRVLIDPAEAEDHGHVIDA